MINAVFISDLHLHREEPAIQTRLAAFIAWAKDHVREIYILGDFFHAWPGDDALDEWSEGIAKQLADLASSGVKLYFMSGNRDFLLGTRFAHMASLTLLKEPTRIELGGKTVLLAHGDRYCTHDKAHQRLRKLTRNAGFIHLFLALPYKIRAICVHKVRRHSQKNRDKPASIMDVVPSALLLHMRAMNASILIHGHIHRPNHRVYHVKGEEYHQYVLSDWDDNPFILCYDDAKGFYFVRL